MSWWDAGSREFKEWLARLVGNVEHGAINLAAGQYGNPVNSGLRDLSKGAGDSLHQIWENSVYGANKIGSDYQRIIGTPTGNAFGDLGNQYDKYVWDPLKKMVGSSEGGTTQPGSNSSPVKPQVIPQYDPKVWQKQVDAEQEAMLKRQSQRDALSQVQVQGVSATAQVFDGRGKTTPHRPALAPPGSEGDFPSRSRDFDKTRDLNDVAQDAYRWDDKQAARMAKLMVEAGYDKAASGDRMVLADIWSHFAAVSALMYQNGQKRTPIELLTRYANGVGASSLGGTKTTTSTQYSVTNAVTARQLAQAALTQRLGRRATDEEVGEFIKALRAEEKKNPTVTTTTATRDAQGDVVSSKSTTKEGLNPNAFATDYGANFHSPEADAYQVAGLLMPMFFDALKSPV